MQGSFTETRLDLENREALITDLAREYHKNYCMIAEMQGYHAPRNCEYYNGSSTGSDVRYCPKCDPMLAPFDNLPRFYMQRFVAGIAGLFAQCCRRFDLGDVNFYKDVLLSSAALVSSVGVGITDNNGNLDVHNPVFGSASVEQEISDVSSGAVSGTASDTLTEDIIKAQGEIAPGVGNDLVDDPE